MPLLLTRKDVIVVASVSAIYGLGNPDTFHRNTITLQDIFAFKQTGLDAQRKVVGSFQATGFVPKFVPKLEALGIMIPRELFTTRAPPVGRRR